jgi:uncharacterized protein YbaA (DUF1428 family)
LGGWPVAPHWPYTDGFVIVVPSSNKKKFIEHAKEGNAAFVELGAEKNLMPFDAKR